MYVIGTAGHVDHGKSTLVSRITGIDPDRLREEKERGLTIDLGFAWLTLPSGRDVSVVDVPGHQRFIKNMLAGAGGLDLAVLVVAADEGPRPQTREHLAILDVLGVPTLVVALTKCDLVEAEWRDLQAAEVEELLASTRYATAPVVPVSATTGEGIDALLAAIDAGLDATPEKTDRRRPRLAVDRVFPMRGFGTVVTGTLVDGALEVGQEVQFQPGGRTGRVRGLQRHGQAVERLLPGTRAAVNVSGVDAHEVERGMVLALPGAMRPVALLAVRLTAVSTLDAPVRRTSGVTFLAGTAETEARLRLLDREEIFPGDEAWALLQLDQPVAVAEGDRFVIRTPNETAAGGVVVMVEPPVRRVRGAGLIALLEQRLAGTPEQKVLARLMEGPSTAGALPAATALTSEQVAAAVDALGAAGDVAEVRGTLYATAWVLARVDDAAAVVREGLHERPLRATVPQEHLRSRLRLDANAFRTVLGRAIEEARLEARGDTEVTLPGYEVTLTSAQTTEVERFLAGLRETRHALVAEAGFSDPELAHYLVESRGVHDLGDGVLLDGGAFEELTARLTEHLRTADQVTLAEARDLLGLSRRYAQAYLEHLDALGITRRVGDARQLRASEASHL